MVIPFENLSDEIKHAVAKAKPQKYERVMEFTAVVQGWITYLEVLNTGRLQVKPGSNGKILKSRDPTRQ